MSGTTLAFDFGLVQPLAVPAAIEAVAPPLWPLQERLVLERIEQPDKLTSGAPLNVSDRSEEGFPRSMVKMHDVSGSSPIDAAAAAPTLMDDTLKMPRNSAGTAAVALPE